MIDLSSEPSLGSLILTRDGALKYSYILPRGMQFPDGSEGFISFTDPAGGEYDLSPHEGEVSSDATGINWLIEPQLLNHVPAGANFEVFAVVDGITYKVRYGRVVRKEVSYPLSPLSVETTPVMYEDDMQRSMPGPRWTVKAGALAMYDIDPTGQEEWAMSARNVVDVFGLGIPLFASSAALWYTPMQSDSVEISLTFRPGGEGGTTVVFASNSSMTDFLGVRFSNRGSLQDVINWLGLSPVTGHNVQVVKGSAWNNLGSVGSIASMATPIDWPLIPPATYTETTRNFKITYSRQSNQVVVYQNNQYGSPVAILTQSVASAAAGFGAGYRYTGLIFSGTLLTAGPRVKYWKVKDAV